MVAGATVPPFSWARSTRSCTSSASCGRVAFSTFSAGRRRRETYRSRASATYIPQHADRAAAREAGVRDHAIEAIEEAVAKFRPDLLATKKKILDGEWVEVPAVRIAPRDLALLIARLQILFGRPAMISEGRIFAATITSEALPIGVLKGIIEATRGLIDAPPGGIAPAPTAPPT